MTLVELPRSPIAQPTKYKLPKTIGPQAVNKVMPWVENYYHERKCYPQTHEFLQRYNVDEKYINDLHGSKLYRNALRERGINSALTGTSFDHELSTEQIATIAVLTNFADTRREEAKLAMLGVSVETYRGWLVDPKFKARLDQESDGVLENIYPDAMQAFARKIKDGDMRAIEKYFEVTGRVAAPETLNLQRALQAVIEAVQKHVKDPDTLAAISAEINIAGAARPVASLKE